MSKESQAPLSLSMEQLLILLEESKKPSKEEQLKNQKALEQRREDALREAAIAAEQREKRIWEVKNCTHKRRDGTCRAVFIQGSNYFLCQKCHGTIYHGSAKTGDKEKDSHVLGTIYDSQLFNELMQMSSGNKIGD